MENPSRTSARAEYLTLIHARAAQASSHADAFDPAMGFHRKPMGTAMQSFSGEERLVASKNVYGLEFVGVTQQTFHRAGHERRLCRVVSTAGSVGCSLVCVTAFRGKSSRSSRDLESHLDHELLRVDW